MRTSIFLLFAALFTVTTVAQQSAPTESLHLRRLTIEASGLAESDRKRITRQLEQGTYSVGELSERLRAQLQDLGYYKVAVYDPRVSVVKEEPHGEYDATCAVDLGARYRIADIRFAHATVFPPEKLRSLFPSKDGDIFNRTSISNGLENLRKLYATEGYINSTSVPDVSVDDKNDLLTLVIDVDEGKAYNFGALVLDGPEPQAGARNALLKSWETLRGKPYSPDVLEQWLKDNSHNLPQKISLTRFLEISRDNDARLVTVRIWFP